jgi:hypothetical protein
MAVNQRESQSLNTLHHEGAKYRKHEILTLNSFAFSFFRNFVLNNSLEDTLSSHDWTKAGTLEDANNALQLVSIGVHWI